MEKLTMETQAIHNLATDLVREHTRHGYEPCWFGPGYSDTDADVIDAIVAGDNWRDLAWDRLMEWESDTVWQDSCDIVNSYLASDDAADVDREDLLDEVRDLLGESVTQDIPLEWVASMRESAVRACLTPWGDPAFFRSAPKPANLLKLAGIACTPSNLAAARRIVAEAFSWPDYRALAIVFRADVTELADVDADMMRIVGQAELWATNPYAGDGWSESVDVDVVVPRDSLAHDTAWCDVFGSTPGYLPACSFQPIASTVAA